MGAVGLRPWQGHTLQWAGVGTETERWEAGGREAQSLRPGMLSASCNGDLKAGRRVGAQPRTEDSRDLSPVPGPGQHLSGQSAGGQGAEVQLQGFAARDLTGQGQRGRGFSTMSLIWRPVHPPQGHLHFHPEPLGPTGHPDGHGVRGRRQLFSGSEWGPSTTGGVLRTRVFGERTMGYPWC